MVSRASCGEGGRNDPVCGHRFVDRIDKQLSFVASFSVFFFFFFRRFLFDLLSETVTTNVVFPIASFSRLTILGASPYHRYG